MAINSMTGFAREAGATGPFQWAWEIKTRQRPRSRCPPRVPPGFEAFGEDARGQVQKALVARHAASSISPLDADGGAPQVRINETALAAAGRRARPAAAADGMRPPSVDGLLAVRGVVEVEDEARGRDGARRTRARARRRRRPLIAALKEARRAEGRALAAIVEGHLDAIERARRGRRGVSGPRSRRPSGRGLRPRSPSCSMQPARSIRRGCTRRRCFSRPRADIREEIDRLHAHIAARAGPLASRRPGRPPARLPGPGIQPRGQHALLQGQRRAVSRIGLDLKAAVDQFREQIQNVE